MEAQASDRSCAVCPASQNMLCMICMTAAAILPVGKSCQGWLATAFVRDMEPRIAGRKTVVLYVGGCIVTTQGKQGNTGYDAQYKHRI